MSELLRLADNELHIPSLEIAQTVNNLGKEFSDVYQNEEEVVAIVFMQGAMIFAADLIRAIDHPNIVVDTVRPKSYVGTRPGDIEAYYLPDGPLHGRHVLLVEDILDKGKTLAKFSWMIAENDLASLRIVSMFEKPECRLPHTTLAGEVTSGIRIADKFVVGYGLDWENMYRHLPHLTIAKEGEVPKLYAEQGYKEFYVPAVHKEAA